MSTAMQVLAPADGTALELTVESLKMAIEREKALRPIIVGYFQDQMRESHHYYNLSDKDKDKKKPALSKEGALNLCSLFKAIPQPEEPTESYHADGHYAARYRVNLVSAQTGHVVATGDGHCSTREAKYAYRWAFSSEVPAHLDKSALEKQTRKSRKSDKEYEVYKVPNADLADLYNTVLKMSYKRALVAAALNLPLVSELFTQDLEEQIAEKSGAANGGEADAKAAAIEGICGHLMAAGKSVADLRTFLERHGAARLSDVETKHLIELEALMAKRRAEAEAQAVQTSEPPAPSQEAAAEVPPEEAAPEPPARGSWEGKLADWSLVEWKCSAAARARVIHLLRQAFAALGEGRVMEIIGAPSPINLNADEVRSLRADLEQALSAA